MRKPALLACAQLLTWLFLRPSSWHNYTQSHQLQPDFTLAQMTRAHWQNPESRRLITAPLALPIFCAILVAILLWLLDVTIPHLIFGMSFAFLFSLLILIVVGVVVSWGMGIAGSMSFGLFGGVLAGLLVKFGAGLESFINGLNTQTILLQLTLGVTFGLMAGIAPQIAQRTQNSAPNHVAALAGMIIGGFMGIVLGVWGLALIRPCPAEANLYPLLGCGDSGFIDSDWTIRWLPFLLIVGCTLLIVGWRTTWRRGLLWGVVFGVIYLLFTQNTIPNQVMRWALSVACDEARCVGFSQLYYATVGVIFGTAVFGTTIVFVVAYALGNQLNGARMGAIAGGTAVFFGMFSWVAFLLVLDPIYRFVWTIPLLKTSFLLAVGLGSGVHCNGGVLPLFYLPTLLWNRWLLFWDRRYLPERATRFQQNGVFWDEGQYLPLFGLVEHLVLLHDYVPERRLPFKCKLLRQNKSGRQTARLSKS